MTEILSARAKPCEGLLALRYREHLALLCSKVSVTHWGTCRKAWSKTLKKTIKMH